MKKLYRVEMEYELYILAKDEAEAESEARRVVESEHVEPEYSYASKAKAVNALKDSDIIDVIDGNRPYSDVLLHVKRRVWESL